MRMRILLVHNYYQQTGGEDVVVEAETGLLCKHGHTVELYSRHNDELIDIKAAQAALDTIWSIRTSNEISCMIGKFRPDIIHVHNTFPLISPSLYWAARSAAVPVVQTLHNFRLMCLNAMFLRAGRVCEDCLGRWPWRGVAHECYRESFTASAVIAGMLTMNRVLRTYRNKLTRYIALTEFCRRKFIEGGLPADRITVKPNFVDHAAMNVNDRHGLLYVGRLSKEKGLSTLAQAMGLLPRVPVRIVGEGNEAGSLSAIPGVTLLGALEKPYIVREMCKARALVVPSIWYETFGMVVIEAFSCGLPVVASRIGALGELIEDGVTGLLFEPDDAQDLADKMRWVMDNPERVAEMGLQAREEYEAKYTPEKNYEQLIAIYEDSIRALGVRHLQGAAR